MKNIILFLGILLATGVNAFAAWDATKPADNEYDYLVPGDVRSNFSAIATGTDPALCLTTAKVCSGTQFTNAMIAPLSSSNMVSGAALYSLSSTPSGAGPLPLVNGGTGQTTRQAALDALAALSLSGTSGEALVSNGSDVVLGYPSNLTITSATNGDILYYNGSVWTRLAAGTSGYVLTSQGTSTAPAYLSPFSLPSQTGNAGKFLTTDGTNASWGGSNHGNQVFTSSGTFTVPTGISIIWVSILGGGGGGGAGDQTIGGDNFGAGGGGSSGYLHKFPLYGVSGSYAVTIGGGGAGGSGACNGAYGGPSWTGCDGGAGGTSSFGSLLSVTGGGGGQGGNGANQGGGGAGGGAGSSYTPSRAAAMATSGSAGGGRGGDNTGVSGAGGSSIFGNGGSSTNGYNQSGGTGGYGAGGGGGAPTNNGSIGGAGGQGIVVVEY